MAIFSVLFISVIMKQFVFVEALMMQTNISPSMTNDLTKFIRKALPSKVSGLVSLAQTGNQKLMLSDIVTLPTAEIVGPKSCPFYHVIQVNGEHLRYMKQLWIVARIVPNGQSTYSDHSAACGLRNFVTEECKCLRYYLNFEKDDSITIQTMSLHIGLQSYRYSENRLIYIDKNDDVFQAQHIFSAVIDAKTLQVSATKSPTKQELYPEYEPFSLLGTDNYQTYAVYATCSHNTDSPLAWVAFSEKAYVNGIPQEAVNTVRDILSKNGISLKSMASVDQKKCLHMGV